VAPQADDVVWSRSVPQVGNDAYLPQQAHHIEFAPVLGYPAACHAHYIYAHRLYPPAGGDDPHKPPDGCRSGSQRKATMSPSFALSASVMRRSGKASAIAADLRRTHGRRARGRAPAQRRVVADPRLVDSADYHAVELDATNRYLLASGRQPQELARVCSSRRPPGNYPIFFGELVLNGGLEVGKGHAVGGDVPLDALGAVHDSGEAGVVQDVV
jgi:hypothetical protein